MLCFLHKLTHSVLTTTLGASERFPNDEREAEITLLMSHADKGRSLAQRPGSTSRSLIQNTLPANSSVGTEEQPR